MDDPVFTKPQTDRSSDVQRIACPTREEFAREHVARNWPVIITGLVDQWPATSKWTPDYLKAVAGDKRVQVRFEEKADFHRFYTPDVPAQDREMTFAQFLDLLLAESPDCRHYLTEYPLHSVSRDLLADVDDRDLVLVRPPIPKFFLGRDTYTCLHYHGHGEALLCQVQGRKEITLFSPADSQRLYARPWHSSLVNFSAVDVRAPDLARHPKFAAATPLRCTLRAGEALYIPLHWWHAIDSPGFSIAVTFFWRAQWRRYHLPLPTLPLLVHTVFAPASIRANFWYARRYVRGVIRLRTRLRAAARWVSGRSPSASSSKGTPSPK